ncbi:hypothetical protein [Sphingomonas xinjiangensis]|uniref:2-beta-glucuronyltransferase n=1 Tax=Sphingomonas xinjiangensis TaxID=643568 RepID=A0A840YNY7_9SPHN|nr:hypothetical protein [Sphingomonas xinjiangensis]MBB5712146.1 2-beta-glucuronyltransferase [Sphingomonas xinjiangensis]
MLLNGSEGSASRSEGLKQRVVILSAFQDYRSRKKASIQQVAEGLSKTGYEVTFISTRFSQLSARTGDSRLFLREKSNKIELVDGVRCYLWRTAVHPFSSKNVVLQALMYPAFEAYKRWPNEDVDQLLSDADYVVVESGVAAIYIERVRRLNAAAKIIYYAADLLDTIGVHPFVQDQLDRNRVHIDHVCLRSTLMKDDFPWAKGRLYKAEFGINKANYERIGPNPYPGGQHAVSVGSMLFDPAYFVAVAEEMPAVTFHVIGSGLTFAAPENVKIYPEMRFVETLPFLKHATIGIAPYKLAPGVEYLAESSLKLAQYDYFGLPSVCPTFAVGEQPNRFGYNPGERASMVATTAVALAAAANGPMKGREFGSWAQVGERMLQPVQHGVPLLA